MKRTTTTKKSRRPVCVVATLSLTFFAVNLMAAKLEVDDSTGIIFPKGSILLKVSGPVTTMATSILGVPAPVELDLEPESPDSDYTGTFFVPLVTSLTTSYDSNKTSGDSNMCWAYAFAGMIAWYQDALESTGVVISSKELRKPVSIVNALKSSSGNYSGSFSRGVSYYIDDGYMLSYINTAAWNPLRPTAYTGYDRTNLESTFSSLTEFSQLILTNLYRGVAFVDLYLPDSVGGHAVAIWGAEFDNGILKAVYISDSDDERDGFVRYDIICEDGWIRLKGHWAPRIHALTFLWAPEGVSLTVPVDQSKTTTATFKSHTGKSVTIKIPHSSPWMKAYIDHYPEDFAERLGDDTDGDGFTDAVEYVIGSDPTDNTKHLKITSFSFDANGMPKITHEPASNDGVSTFTIEGSPTPSGPWKLHTDSDTSNRFFRVIASPLEE